MAEDFSRHVARVVASQIAEATGFDACQDSAVEILGDLLLRYLSTVCSSGHSYAEIAGRIQSNLSDVLLALEDLGVTPEDLHQHMQLQQTDVPFAHTLAQYPVHRQQPLPPTFKDHEETPPSHIPAFLPAFPDPHTYQHTAAYAGHQTDPHKQRQSMLEAKQKSEAALQKLHQRISSKVAQQDTNPFVAAPILEQLPLQLPALPAAAAAVAAAAVAGAGADDLPSEPGNGATGGPCTAAAAATGVANGPSSSDQPLSAADAAAAGTGGLGKAAAGSTAGAQQQQQQLLPLPFLQQRNQRQRLGMGSAAAAAGGDGELDEEDMLFESAAVLKAFSSVLPPELLAQHMERLGGASSNEQQRQKQGHKDGKAKAANGIDGVEFIEEEEPAAMEVDAAGAAAGAAVDPAQQWLSWDPQQQQQQQQQQRPASLLGPGGAAGAELLRFGIDPLASGKSTALRLAGGQRPQDAFAERSSSGRKELAAAAGTGVRQRKSKYDVADPRQQKAEGILNASPEAVYATTTEGRQGAVYGEMFGAAMDEDL